MLSSFNSLNDFKKINKNDLKPLCDEIRSRIISVMSQTGGHLASNLGVIELTVALHFVFDFNKDKLIFDVGHQCYTHKILTGRNPQFDTIRKKNGISGFPRIFESKYDPVDSGHASSSISSAVGYAVASKIKQENYNTVVIIGDGSLTGGEAFEGLNQAGSMNLPLVVILNNNEMSIGKNVGALSTHISKLLLSKPYIKLTRLYERIMKKRKGIIRFLFFIAKKFEKGLKRFIGIDNIFTQMGFDYYGPLDGHNLDQLIYVMEKIKPDITKPVLIHVKTVKGKGYKPAEGDPTQFHGVTPSLMTTNDNIQPAAATYTDLFGEAITKIAKKHKDIIAVTAAMESGTGLNLFKLDFPSRFFDVGIAEQHAVTFCGAMAHAGLKPVFAVYSTFLMRALDQLTQDVCISSAPVIFAIDRAGIVGPDGETHQGQFDINYLRILPNITVLAPCDGTELELMLEYAYTRNSPVAIRYPRDKADYNQIDTHPPIEFNPLIEIISGTEILLIVIGPYVSIAKEISKNHEGKIGVVYLRFIKPTPDDLIINIIKKYKKVIVVEETVFNGSVSEWIAYLITHHHTNTKFSSINLPDRFIEHDTRSNILKEFGFSYDGILRAISDL